MPIAPFTIMSINISTRKGVQKEPGETGVLVADHGLDGDAHAGPWHRQVSFLADEDVDSMRGKGIDLHISFAQPITDKAIEQLVVICRRLSISIEPIVGLKRKSNHEFLLWDQPLKRHTHHYENT